MIDVFFPQVKVNHGYSKYKLYMSSFWRSVPMLVWELSCCIGKLVSQSETSLSCTVDLFKLKSTDRQNYTYPNGTAVPKTYSREWKAETKSQNGLNSYLAKR